MKKRYLAAIIAVFLILLVSASGSIEISAYGPIPSDLNTGPYVDSINFQVISGQDQRILALQAGTIEMDTSIFDPSYYLQLSADPDISVYSGLRNGYGHITINCRDWPLNETVLRRAFAYAFNKTRVTTEIMDGWSVEHDSLVPIVNSWCIEDQFSFHYYYDEAVLANQILNDSGIFEINSETGFRAYHGQSFNIEVEYPSTSPALGGGIAQIGVDALHALHINASICASNYIELISRLDSHGSYDMAFYAQDFHGDNVEWLANEYWSEYADIPMQNPTNFENATYDSYRSQLLNGTTYNEVYNASSMMQKILQEQVPRLVVYENIYNQAYRTDVFTGHIPDINNYITGPWTMRKIHRLDGGLGGTVPISINMEPDCFNIYSISSATSAMILSNLYSSLYKEGPNLQPWPDLAQSMLIETHEDNPAVPLGHTKYTIDLIQNATWNDGMPITSQDIEFTFNYILESYNYGNPAGTSLRNLVSVESTSAYTVEFEFDIESYWLFYKFAYQYIIPSHVYDGTSYSSWATAIYPDVTSGPFNLGAYEEGDWYSITKNPLYYYRVPNPSPVVSRADNLTYTEGTTGNTIVWEISDDNPLMYAIYRDYNVTSLVMDIWDGSDITLNVDGLSVGSYNYTLFAFDYSANIVTSSITVTVVPASTNTSSTTTTSGQGAGIDPMVILISVGSAGIIIIVALLMWRSKQSLAGSGG